MGVNESTSRILPDAGFCDPKRLPKGPRGFSLCRRCGTECASARRTFCSDACVHEWRVRSDPGYAARQVLRRDKGVCAKCGRDCVALRRQLHEPIKDSFYPHPHEPTPRQLNERAERMGIPLHLISRRLWEMNHRQAVVEGGGSCGLDNLETLCWACHRAHTRELAGRRARARKGQK